MTKKPSSATLSFSTQRGPVSFQVSIAQTESERQQGLMNVKTLAPNAGMLFIFTEDSDHAFWMRNTLIPLDMIFIDRNWTIVGIVDNAVPNSLQPRSVGKASRYVLEIAGGQALANSIVTGMKGTYDF
jgi:uncharacterized membrane protein (UPF0127 family)